MNHLIVYAHPSEGSFNHAILETAVTGLQKKGHDVVVRDLYAIGFQPVVSSSEIIGGLGEDIVQEQEHLKWADVITFIYPIWWTGMPAIMKGYIDRVFSYGFAYKYVNGVQMGLLKGKKAVILNTQGKSHADYAKSGMDQALRLTSDKGIFEYCGFEILYHIFFESVPESDEATRKQWLEQIADMASKA
ncbi:NAD(P)H-dependent oxidoreductase [Paenibacillus alba]|uniref:NAD(P)H-dependent oxidoreductase n=1 Tax=Paenibacillus alba TaxID=1197127 RepID=A0ABU6FW81_9BACL|nr:NAD(P)H-dependent oxidoreductase [Paenibacillus alba]MEC0226160.1 NAD(P)H-dependent oxidoreductase [Paenibacillus alba]NQX68623.1 NAD(P)H-dependent oxidoreductase [Paenibacillus alba]